MRLLAAERGGGVWQKGEENAWGKYLNPAQHCSPTSPSTTLHANTCLFHTVHCYHITAAMISFQFSVVKPSFKPKLPSDKPSDFWTYLGWNFVCSL